MNRVFVGQSWNIAEELSHFFVYAVGFPHFPADFEVGEKGRIVEGEEEVSLDMAVRESVIWVVDPGFPWFKGLGCVFLRNGRGSSGNDIRSIIYNLLSIFNQYFMILRLV